MDQFGHRSASSDHNPILDLRKILPWVGRSLVATPVVLLGFLFVVSEGLLKLEVYRSLRVDTEEQDYVPEERRSSSWI